MLAAGALAISIFMRHTAQVPVHSTTPIATSSSSPAASSAPLSDPAFSCDQFLPFTPADFLDSVLAPWKFGSSCDFHIGKGAFLRFNPTKSGIDISNATSGKFIQTISYSQNIFDGISNPDFPEGYNQAPPIFLEDVTFDGYLDFSIVTAYSNQGAYVDYWIYNPSLGRFTKDPVLTGLSNADFSSTTQEITAHDQSSACLSFDTTYAFTHNHYVLAGEKTNDDCGAQ